jgi:uncharacterized membrane protein
MASTPFPRSTASILGHPIHVMLVPIPIACFIGALFSDLAYWGSANMQWANFSAWLLAIGLIVAVFAVIAGLVDFLFCARIRRLADAWIHGLGNAIAITLAIFNSFIHARDGWTSVVPGGLILSFLTVLVLLVTGWKGWALVHRHGVGVEADMKRPAS